MKRFTKLFLALTLVGTPVALTSCDSEFYIIGTERSLVDEAIYNFNRSGLVHRYFVAYNWLLTYYPELDDVDFDTFMGAVLNGSPTDYYWDDYNSSSYYWNNNYNSEYNSQNNVLLAEARALTGEWVGNVVYEYTDEKTNKRVRDQFMANMKFFQYNASANSLSGNGIEIDKDKKGNTQVLDFSWYVSTDGSIYIKYARTGTTFILDASKQNFHLGPEQGKTVDTFFGDAYSSNTTDYMVLDLERVSSRAAVKRSGKSFGGATKNTFAEKTIDAQSRLHIR